MKKFKFSLDALLTTKQAQEKQLRKELAQIQALMLDLKSERQAHKAAIDHLIAARADLLRQGSHAVALQQFQLTYLQLAEKLEQSDRQIEKKERELGECREKLVAQMSEIKGLEKLETQQFLEHQQEKARLDEAEINDLVSYRTTMAVEGRYL